MLRILLCLLLNTSTGCRSLVFRWLRNNKSARLHADFVDQAVLELVNSGRVRMVNEQPFVVNPLSVSIQPCSKKRLILDLSH